MTTKSATALDQQIGLRIRKMRKKAHMSQEFLGKQLGVSFQQIQKYENGVNRITASRLVDIAKCLNISVMYFLDLAEPGFPAHTIQGIRHEFNEAVRHFNNVGESIGMTIRADQRA